MNRISCMLLGLCLLSVPGGAKAGPDGTMMGDSVVGAPISTEMRLMKDSVILFRFVPGQMDFYSPYRGNDKSITRAVELIERHRKEIAQGKAYITVKGFCGSYDTDAENLAAAKTRSNHVKSYFILHSGMKEDYYRTRNYTHSYKGITDVVALMGIEYMPEYHPEPSVAAQPEPQPKPEPQPGPQTQPEKEPVAPAELQPSVETATPSFTLTPAKEYHYSAWTIGTNLLYDVMLAPSFELEYRIAPKWSMAVEVDMPWWSNDSKHKYYQLAAILPEVRHWFGSDDIRRGHYVGLFGGGGWYDLENGGKGYKGEGGMIGISYGYRFPVGRYFSLEAGVGVGYLTTEYEEYSPIDGHYVYQQTSRTNYFGPLKLKFSWIWHIGQGKGGNRK